MMYDVCIVFGEHLQLSEASSPKQAKNSGIYIKHLLSGSRRQLFREKFIGKKRNSARDNPESYYG